MSSGPPLKALRRTASPYIGLAIIFLGVTVSVIWVAVRTSQWDILWSLAFLWPAAICGRLYFGLKYRVLWDESGVVMRASGGPERRIQFGEIGKIQYETARFNEIVSQSRPFRRIVILPHGHVGKDWIDVSLRHFLPEDIEELLRAIHARRPDLQMPRIPELERACGRHASRQ